VLDWDQSRKHATYSKEVSGTDGLANTAKNGLGIIIIFLTSTYVETAEVDSHVRTFTRLRPMYRGAKYAD
jgi:hypothetical protein